MCKLSINVDHVATLRQARKAIYPDPVEAALLCELAGADGITIHLRGDRRHIQDRDLRFLRQEVKTSLNLEMAATDEMLKIAKEVKPDTVTLVPERPQELTTEGGLDLKANLDTLSKAIAELKNNGMKVSLFINPDEKSVEKSAELNADYIEINTDSYCESKDEDIHKTELEKVRKIAELAHKKGLGIHAGHGLNYKNAKDLMTIKEIEEVSIGHAIVARAVIVGMEKAVKEMIEIIKS
ncbi:MAG: pyridoxine 5'-phosphate synthase [Candidatus Zixiibacteriota bacterium]